MCRIGRLPGRGKSSRRGLGRPVGQSGSGRRSHWPTSIGDTTLSDGRSSGERAPTRRSVRAGYGSMAICATRYCDLVTFYLLDIAQIVLARYGKVGALALRRVYWHVGQRMSGERLQAEERPLRWTGRTWAGGTQSALSSFSMFA